MKKSEYLIVTAKGTDLVKGVVSTNLGIHKDENIYSITHLNTGFRVTYTYKLKHARIIVKALESSTIPWSLIGINNSKKYESDVFKIIREVEITF